MNVSQASRIWLVYYQVHSKHDTFRDYNFIIARFNQNSEILLGSFVPDFIIAFKNLLSG